MECTLFETTEGSNRSLAAERDRLAALLQFLLRRDLAPPIELRPSNPHLPINWRWRLAGYVADLPRTIPEIFLDSWTSRAVTHLRNANLDDGDLANVTGLAQILTGYRKKNLRPEKVHQEHFQRYVTAQELCARLVAGETNDQIAERLSLPPVVVEGFEQLHFAVRERLDVPSCIRFQAIGENRGGPLERLGALWRHYGYARGTAVLDRLVTRYKTFPADVRTLGIEAYLARGVQCPDLVRLLVQVRLLDVTPKDAEDSLRWLIRARGRLRKAQPIAAHPEDSVENPAANQVQNPAENPAREPAATNWPTGKAA